MREKRHEHSEQREQSVQRSRVERKRGASTERCGWTESGKNKAEAGRGQMFRARTRGKTLSLHSENKGMPLKSFPGGQEAGWRMGVIRLAVGAVKGGVGGGSFGEPC